MRSPLRHTLVAAVVLALLAPATASAAAPPAGHGDLSRVTELAADRLELADTVAAAKWGTGKPIEDPAREQAVLDEVAERSAAAGVDGEEATAVFRDQIEASKLVQRGLHARWEQHPSERPATRPDLDEIRPVLDGITTRLLAALGDTDDARNDVPTCVPKLTLHAVQAAQEGHFDGLHSAGLARAVPSVCG